MSSSSSGSDASSASECPECPESPSKDAAEVVDAQNSLTTEEVVELLKRGQAKGHSDAALRLLASLAVTGQALQHPKRLEGLPVPDKTDA